MQIYFLRHGAAEERRSGLSDYDRKLTDEGISEMEAVAKGMRRLDLGIDAVITSPLVRAEETARIAARELGIDNVEVDERLSAGDFRIGALQAIAEGRQNSRALLFVGHEPDFSTVVGELIGGGAVEMKKAGLARVEVFRPEPGGGVLRWLLTPRHLIE